MTKTDRIKTEMNDAMVEQVSGGSMSANQVIKLYTGKSVKVHDGCGGEIDNPLFGYATCNKCGEKHWFISDFKYHTEKINIKPAA